MIEIGIGLAAIAGIAVLIPWAGKGRITSGHADDDEPSDYQQSTTATPRRIATRPSEMPLRRQP